MRILVLIHEYPPVGGGGGRAAQDIAEGLVRHGHELRVLTAHLESLANDEIVAGVRVQRIPSVRQAAFRAELIEMARYDWAAFSLGLQCIRDWKPDLIHVHFAVPAGAAAFALSKITGVPYILTAHLGDVPGAVPEKTDRWFKWLFPFTPAIWRGAARVVAVSEFTRQLALQHYRVGMDVIPNGVAMDRLPPRSPASAVPHIVFAGRFVDQKNPQHLVQALARLKHLPWTCSMLGDGPLLETVRGLAHSCGMAERFSFPGWVTPQNVLEVFARSALLVLPSRSEGLSVVGVQALGMGLALVLSNAGGNAELVQEGQNGFLFQVGDLDGLCAALSRLLENPTELQAAQQSSLEKARKFDLETVIAQYETMFEAVNRNP